MWMDNWVLNTPPALWPQAMGLPENVLFRFFEPKRVAVVLANSNLAETEVNTDFCKQKNICILKRKGGGGTVLLGPGCVVLTFAFLAKDVFNNQHYFSVINQMWIAALDDMGLHGLVQRGHSDIAHGEKKIAGTSLFRKKYLVVYQGSLLVDPDFVLIGQALQHPSKEPDYRGQRSHRDFLTSTRELGLEHTASDIAKNCDTYFRNHLSATIEFSQNT